MFETNSATVKVEMRRSDVPKAYYYRHRRQRQNKLFTLQYYNTFPHKAFASLYCRAILIIFIIIIYKTRKKIFTMKLPENYISNCSIALTSL